MSDILFPSVSYGLNGNFTVLGAISILGWSILPNMFPRLSDLSALSTAVYGIGAATTILVTTLAIARLLLVRQCHIKVMGMCLKLIFHVCLEASPMHLRSFGDCESIHEYRCHSHRVVCPGICVVSRSDDFKCY